MIEFTLNSVSAVGNANVQENGDTIQNCIIEIKITGLQIGEKIISDMVELTVPNSVFVGADMPTVAGWLHIQNVLAPQWVADNYTSI